MLFSIKLFVWLLQRVAEMVRNLVELFFCKKKIPLSRRVEYVMDGSMDQSVSQ